MHKHCSHYFEALDIIDKQAIQIAELTKKLEKIREENSSIMHATDFLFPMSIPIFFTLSPPFGLVHLDREAAIIYQGT